MTLTQLIEHHKARANAYDELQKGGLKLPKSEILLAFHNEAVTFLTDLSLTLPELR